MHFKNRSEAGQSLAQALKQYQTQSVVVYAIPRGGVVIAVEIARVLQAPLDLVITRKIGYPNQPEYAIAAVAEDGHMLGSATELQAVDKDWLAMEIEKQRQEAKRRRQHYLHNRPHVSAEDKIAILVDDGIATGTTLRLGIQELKHKQCKKIIVAVPVAPKSIADLIRKEADAIVALEIPEDYEYLGAVGAYYGDFAQLEDKEVTSILDEYEKEYSQFGKH